MPTTDELTGWAARLAELLDAMPDDPGADVLDALHACADEYEAAVSDKVDAIVHVLQAMEDHEEIAKRDKRRADASIAHWRRQQDRVRGLLHRLASSSAALTGQRTIRTTRATVTLREAVEYRYPEAVEDWPVVWLDTVETVKPDREAARHALDAGEEIPGFARAEVDRIQVRQRR